MTLKQGAVAVSDPVDLRIPELGDLAISLWIQDSIRTTTRHSAAHQRSFVSARGDFTSAATLSPDTTITAWLWLSGVDVTNAQATGVVVAIGNSITDGSGTTLNANARWPDVLARRLLGAREPRKGIVNAGIGGNRLLGLNTGPSALARFDRDVLMQPGATHVILLEGINDILRSPPDTVTVGDMIFGYKQLITRAHDHGLIIYGATLTPIGGLVRSMTPGASVKRTALNEWIRTSGMFDGVIDFDAATRDPAQPDRFLPAFDSGDHLHPSDAGYKAMGESIDLALFRRTMPSNKR